MFNTLRKVSGALWALRRYYIYCEKWKLLRKKRKPSVCVKVKGRIREMSLRVRGTWWRAEVQNHSTGDRWIWVERKCPWPGLKIWVRGFQLVKRNRFGISIPIKLASLHLLSFQVYLGAVQLWLIWRGSFGYLCLRKFTSVSSHSRMTCRVSCEMWGMVLTMGD